MRRLLCGVVALAAVSCGGSPPAAGTFELPDAQVDQYDTAYLASVVADPEGDDLAEGGGEHVVVGNNWDHRADLGGWAIEDADGNRLPLGIGRQVDAGSELRVHSSCGEDSDDAVFACLDDAVLDDDGDVLVLQDSAGNEVARFAYGAAAG